jgi:hypothetical protein
MLFGSVLIVLLVPLAWLFLLGKAEKELIVGVVARVLKRV